MSDGRRLEVDGEEFVVRRGVEGGTHYHWVSGPNSNYGFSSSYAGDGIDEHVHAIRGFLAMVDPATGYIGD